MSTPQIQALQRELRELNALIARTLPQRRGPLLAKRTRLQARLEAARQRAGGQRQEASTKKAEVQRARREAQRRRLESNMPGRGTAPTSAKYQELRRRSQERARKRAAAAARKRAAKRAAREAAMRARVKRKAAAMRARAKRKAAAMRARAKRKAAAMGSRPVAPAAPRYHNTPFTRTPAPPGLPQLAAQSVAERYFAAAWPIAQQIKQAPIQASRLAASRVGTPPAYYGQVVHRLHAALIRRSGSGLFRAAPRPTYSADAIPNNMIASGAFQFNPYQQAGAPAPQGYAPQGYAQQMPAGRAQQPQEDPDAPVGEGDDYGEDDDTPLYKKPLVWVGGLAALALWSKYGKKSGKKGSSATSPRS